MKLIIASTFLLTLCLSPLASAEDAASPAFQKYAGPKLNEMPVFRGADLNDNGTVEKQEWLAVHLPEVVFDSLDTDKNQTLTYNEFSKHNAPAAIDLNKDGNITLDETTIFIAKIHLQEKTQKNHK
ncbi:MAG: EF-hand domain-containing protein [Opitutaceae bacterium]|nr:EF-hand domain-containing protein [Opitutaceae bacterium]